MNLNVKIFKDKTVMDILYELEPQTDGHQAISRTLSRKGALRASKIRPTATFSDTLAKNMSCLEKWALSRYREKLLMSDENRNAVLVVAVLIATATYEALLSPPGGVWQGDPTLMVHNRTDLALEYVGTPVLEKEGFIWGFFSLLNTAAFYISLGVIYNLLPRRPLTILPLVLPLFLCYATSWYSTQVGTDVLFVFVISAAAIYMFLWGILKRFRRAWRDMAHLIAGDQKLRERERGL